MKRKMWRNKRLKKGSLTIETACLMPAILLVIFSLLGLCFFVHNRCYLTAAGLEASLTGAMDAHRQGGSPKEAANLRARERASIGFYGMENLRMQVEERGGITVSYQGETPVLYGGLRWDMSSEGSAKILKPAEKLRRQRVWKNGKE